MKNDYLICMVKTILIMVLSLKAIFIEIGNIILKLMV